MTKLASTAVLSFALGFALARRKVRPTLSEVFCESLWRLPAAVRED